MPFEPNNNLWKKSHESRAANKDRLAAFFEVVADGGIDAYGQKLDDLANKEELSKAEQEFMDRFERLMPYVKPKLSTQIVDLTSGGEKIDFKNLSNEQLIKLLTKAADSK